MRIITPQMLKEKKLNGLFIVQSMLESGPSEPGIIKPVLQGPESPSFLGENWWKQLVGHRTHLDYGTLGPD